jgi:Spy/CpxP family protein refolding chaperone
MKLIQGSFARRALVVGLIAGSGILAASSFAMPAGDATGKAGCEAGHGQKMQGKSDEQRARHLSELKEKLKLSAKQESAWNAFASASKPAPQRGSKQAMRGEFEKMSTPERLDKMQAMSEMRHARMAERSKAVKVFYAELSPEQRVVFDAGMKPRHRGHGQHRQHS